MCACKEYEHCHRRLVAERLREHGLDVARLCARPEQETLF
jgi:uncharacterized protein (DUF488 family)